MKTNRSKLFTLMVVAAVSSLATLLIVFGTSNVGARQQQQFTGNEDHVVTLEQAVKFVQNYQIAPSVPTIKGGFFGRSIFEKILSQNGCVGIRYYYAKKDDGGATMVLVGVDNMSNDMTSGVLGDIIYPCPPYCGTSVLNK